MPSRTKDHTVAASFVRESWVIDVDAHLIKTVTLLDLYRGATINNAYGEIGLMLGGTASENRIAVLSCGYLGKMSAVAWSGSIMTEEGMYVYADIYAPVGTQFRLAVILLKIFGVKDGRLVVDP